MIRHLRRSSAAAPCLLVLLALAPRPGLAEPPPASTDGTATHRWHTARRGASNVPRDVVEAHPEDWNPPAGPAASAKDFLKQAGITTDLFVMFFYQRASDVQFGGRDFGSFAYRSVGDWEFAKDTPFGNAFLEWNLAGAVGLSFDEEDESIAGGFKLGDQSVINTNVYPDSSALDELFWKQVAADGRWAVMAGRVDQSFHFDSNRVAFDSERKLQSFVFVNNLSIPWPLYGGLGGVVTWKATDRLTLRAGGGESGSDEPWKFWKTLDDGNWYQLFETELRLDVPGLGKGAYRLTPWHNHLDGEDGWGVGVNVDQELGFPWLVGFFRFGAGDSDVTPVERTVSGGIAVEGPFGRSGDYFALGVGWSRPSEPDARDETFLEVQYRLQLTKTLELSPNLQVVLDPASNPDNDTIVIGGIRLTMPF